VKVHAVKGVTSQQALAFPCSSDIRGHRGGCRCDPRRLPAPRRLALHDVPSAGASGTREGVDRQAVTARPIPARHYGDRMSDDAAELTRLLEAAEAAEQDAKKAWEAAETAQSLAQDAMHAVADLVERLKTMIEEAKGNG
jgi:hypothetical protein